MRGLQAGDGDSRADNHRPTRIGDRSCDVAVRELRCMLPAKASNADTYDHLRHPPKCFMVSPFVVGF